MVKLLFKAYKKINTKRSSEKKHVKSTKIFLKNKKTKGINMLGSDIEILPEKKKRRNVNMVVSNIKIF